MLVYGDCIVMSSIYNYLFHLCGNIYASPQIISCVQYTCIVYHAKHAIEAGCVHCELKYMVIVLPVVAFIAGCKLHKHIGAFTDNNKKKSPDRINVHLFLSVCWPGCVYDGPHHFQTCMDDNMLHMHRLVPVASHYNALTNLTRRVVM